MTTKTIYAKLVDARSEFHKLPLKKSGFNAFHKFTYFELSDFLIPGLECLAAEGLLPVISFTDELATMTIYDTGSGESIAITSPMRNVEMKGSNAMQSLGAAETYNSRYLWVAALQIVENDQIDGLKQEEPEKKSGPKPATDEQRKIIEGFPDEQIPARRLSWLQKGDNFDTMSFAAAKTIISECEQMPEPAGPDVGDGPKVINQ